MACGATTPLPHAAGRHRASSGLAADRSGPTAPERLSAERRARRLARYEQVVALHAAGTSLLGIARQLGCAVKTAHAWVQAGSFPERRVRAVPQPRVLDPFAGYVRRRYDAGLDSARTLERELRPLGFRGSYQAVGRYLRHLRRTHPRGPAPVPAPTTSAPPAFTAREAIWVLQRADAEATPEERRFLAALIAHCPALARVHELAVAFRTMFRARDPNALRPWLVAARGSALASFAASLTRDFDAVLAALVFPWSSGQVEGQVHRLKLVKRSMYGRAHLPLLRARMLGAA